MRSLDLVFHIEMLFITKVKLMLIFDNEVYRHNYNEWKSHLSIKYIAVNAINTIKHISNGFQLDFFYLIPCLHQFRGHSWFPIQQIIVKFILPGSTRFGALP